MTIKSGAAPVEPSEAPRGFVSVVVPHYSDLRGLSACLEALERQTYPRDGFEIVVADNASPEGRDAVAAAIAGRARLAVVNDRGAGPARNGGVALTTGAILAFTDSDCLPEPGWLRAGLAALCQHDVVGGAMRVLVADPARPTGAEAFESVFAFDNESYVRRKGFTVTANLFCRREVFDAVGGFRVGVSEDIDWCHRATAAGYRLGYAAGAVVGHPARHSWTDLKKKWRRMNSESFGLTRARKGGRLIWLARTLVVPLSALLHTPRVFASRGLRGLSQRLSAIGMLYRIRTWRFIDALRLLFDDIQPKSARMEPLSR